MKTYADVLPQPENKEAELRFADAYAEPIVDQNWWRIACALLIVAVLGLTVLNMRTAAQKQDRVVVRIDDIGRAQAVGITTLGQYQPHENEIRYFLGAFVVAHYSRRVATVRREYPKSLLFLSIPLAQARMEVDAKTKEIEKFLATGQDEIDVQVNNVVLTNIASQPYSARVVMDKVRLDHSGREVRRERYEVSMEFILSSAVANNAISVNPLGFAITSIRADEAFK